MVREFMVVTGGEPDGGSNRLAGPHLRGQPCCPNSGSLLDLWAGLIELVNEDFVATSPQHQHQQGGSRREASRVIRGANVAAFGSGLIFVQVSVLVYVRSR